MKCSIQRRSGRASAVHTLAKAIRDPPGESQRLGLRGHPVQAGERTGAREAEPEVPVGVHVPGPVSAATNARSSAAAEISLMRNPDGAGSMLATARSLLPCT
jgi:hypothetical protein